MKKVFLTVLCVLLSVFAFAKEYLLEMKFSTKTDIVSYFPRNDFIELKNPKIYARPHTKTYKVKMNGADGEIHISSAAYQSSSKQEYEECVIRYYGLFDANYMTPPSSSMQFLGIGDEGLKNTKSDLGVYGPILERKKGALAEKEYAVVVFFIKYGRGIIACEFLSDDINFFNKNNDKDNNISTFFKNPCFQFSDKDIEIKKVDPKKSFPHFKEVSSGEDDFIEYFDNENLKIIDNNRREVRFGENVIFLPNFRDFNCTKRFFFEDDVLKGEVRYSVFKDIGTDQSNRKKEIENLKKFCFQQIYGYDDGKYANFNDNDAKAEFNADFGGTKFSKDTSSFYAGEYDSVSTEFFYKENVGFVVRTTLLYTKDLCTEDILKNFMTLYNDKNFHTFKFKD